MAAWLRGLLLLLLPLALADTTMPCDGYEVVEDMWMEDLDNPNHFGVRILEDALDDEEENCWSRCCSNDKCDLAVLSDGKCHLVKCEFNGFNLCQLTKKEGVRSFKKLGAGVQPKQEDYCLSPSETGKCRARFIKWWYDAKTETCKNFTYGGCAGNLNNHIGEEECMTKCRGVTVSEAINPKPLVSVGSLPEACRGPAVVGNCRAAFPRWYFNTESRSCNKFIYGGCEASKNNHMTEQDCVKTCLEAHEDEGSVDHSVLRHPLAAVVLPILLAVLAAALLCAMILVFVKVAKKNQQEAGIRAMWNPIDDKECLVNNAYTL